MNTIPIYQINGKNSQLSGCGTMIGDLFVTAGHVIAETIEPYIVAEGKKILLDDTRVIFCADDSKNGGLDLALYRIPEIKSDIALSDEMPETGTILKSVSYILIPYGQECIECDVTVNNVREGYYYGGNTSLNLKAGSSGSPVLSGNKVVGIMCAGNNDNYDNQLNKDYPLNFCVFLSSKAILDKING